MKSTIAPIRSSHFSAVFLAALVAFGAASAREATMLDMATFGAKTDGTDTTPSVRAALDEGFTPP